MTVIVKQLRSRGFASISNKSGENKMAILRWILLEVPLYINLELESLIFFCRWSNIHQNLFATSGRPGNQVHVYHVDHHKVCLLT